MQVNEKSAERIPLQFSSKALYNHLLQELGKLHIHSFDIQAFVETSKDEYKLFINFGENFSNSIDKTFTKEQVDRLDEKITNFFKEVGEKIKETLINDYFKMMKP